LLTNASKWSGRAVKGLSAAIAAAIICGGASIFSGCIADTAEDTDLPWASNKKWEGIAPVSPSVTDRYD
jgi:hypothetical protein